MPDHTARSRSSVWTSLRLFPFKADATPGGSPGPLRSGKLRACSEQRPCLKPEHPHGGETLTSPAAPSDKPTEREPFPKDSPCVPSQRESAVAISILDMKGSLQSVPGSWRQVVSQSVLLTVFQPGTLCFGRIQRSESQQSESRCPAHPPRPPQPLRAQLQLRRTREGQTNQVSKLQPVLLGERLGPQMSFLNINHIFPRVTRHQSRDRSCTFGLPSPAPAHTCRPACNKLLTVSSSPAPVSTSLTVAKAGGGSCAFTISVFGPDPDYVELEASRLGLCQPSLVAGCPHASC